MPALLQGPVGTIQIGTGESVEGAPGTIHLRVGRTSASSASLGKAAADFARKKFDLSEEAAAALQTAATEAAASGHFKGLPPEGLTLGPGSVLTNGQPVESSGPIGRFLSGGELRLEAGSAGWAGGGNLVLDAGRGADTTGDDANRLA